MSLTFIRGWGFLAACTECGAVQQTSTEHGCVACAARKVVDGYANIIVQQSLALKRLTEIVERLVNP